jgi:hypothetical protein
MNKHASELGKMGKGKAKTLSEGERTRRAEWAKTLALKRWAKVRDNEAKRQANKQ